MAPPGARHDTIPKTTQNRKWWLIDPNDSRKVSWDLFVGVFIVYSVLSVPFFLGFQVSPSGGWRFLDRITDALFWMDMILSFCTMYEDETKQIVTDEKTVAKRYLKGWFAIDFLSTFPFEDALSGVMGTIQPITHTYIHTITYTYTYTCPLYIT